MCVYFYFHCSQAHFQRWLDHFCLPSQYSTVFFFPAFSCWFFPCRTNFLPPFADTVFHFFCSFCFTFSVRCVYFQSIQLISWISQTIGWASLTLFTIRMRFIIRLAFLLSSVDGERGKKQNTNSRRKVREKKRAQSETSGCGKKEQPTSILMWRWKEAIQPNCTRANGKMRLFWYRECEVNVRGRCAAKCFFDVEFVWHGWLRVRHCIVCNKTIIRSAV